MITMHEFIQIVAKFLMSLVSSLAGAVILFYFSSMAYGLVIHFLQKWTRYETPSPSSLSAGEEG